MYQSSGQHLICVRTQPKKVHLSSFLYLVRNHNKMQSSLVLFLPSSFSLSMEAFAASLLLRYQSDPVLKGGIINEEHL